MLERTVPTLFIARVESRGVFPIAHTSMRLFRRLIALFLMVTLPAYAWATLDLAQACPMQAAVMEMGDCGHACCDPVGNEQGQPDKPHPCKPGQECKTGGLYQPELPRTTSAFQAATILGPAAASLLASRDPSGVWRPPRPY
ncbi:MAG: hypothetical protein HYS20_13685 [Rhodocyclales bacterium]|nr:hypothetical protein [Rhodocyclales bacterium]